MQLEVEKHLAPELLTERNGSRPLAHEEFEPDLEHANGRSSQGRPRPSERKRREVERVSELTSRGMTLACGGYRHEHNGSPAGQVQGLEAPPEGFAPPPLLLRWIA